MLARHIDPLRICIEARCYAKDPLLILMLVHIRIRTSLFFGLSFRSFRSCLESNGGKGRDKLQRTRQDSESSIGELHTEVGKMRRDFQDLNKKRRLRMGDIKSTLGAYIRKISISRRTPSFNIYATDG